jgi:hypothetical protein
MLPFPVARGAMLMVIVGVVLLVAYMGFVVALIVRGEGTEGSPSPLQRLRTILTRPGEAIRALRRRAASAVGHTRATPATDDERLKRPLTAYADALAATLATVEALDPTTFGTRASDRREFEEVAVQALVAAHTLRQLADAAGVCADACAATEASRRRDPGSFRAPRANTPQHQLRETF